MAAITPRDLRTPSSHSIPADQGPTAAAPLPEHTPLLVVGPTGCEFVGSLVKAYPRVKQCRVMQQTSRHTPFLPSGKGTGCTIGVVDGPRLYMHLSRDISVSNAPEESAPPVQFVRHYIRACKATYFITSRLSHPSSLLPPGYWRYSLSCKSRSSVAAVST